MGSLDSGATKLTFDNDMERVVDLLVCADGGWSAVHKYNLGARDETTADERWVPVYTGMTGFYVISSQLNELLGSDGVEDLDTHGIWLDQGVLSCSPLPKGKIRWDL